MLLANFLMSLHIRDLHIQNSIMLIFTRFVSFYFVLNSEDEHSVTKKKRKKNPKQTNLQMSLFWNFWDIKHTFSVLRGIHYPPLETVETDNCSNSQHFLFLQGLLTV